jgi:hypothetical protein
MMKLRFMYPGHCPGYRYFTPMGLLARASSLSLHLDLILIELLAAVMWFNPVVWLMRNKIQLVHEYLADEGALGTGIDK